MNEIYLAGGCFWGIQEYFSRVNGVVSTRVGFANSDESSPSYERVCSGKTNAAETVKIVYDKQLSLNDLLEKMFKVINPTILNRQGNDVGTQYRTGIYYTDEDSALIIKKFIEEKQKVYQEKIVTEVLPLKNFFEAEEYHQHYLKKNPNGYCHINLD